MLLSNLEHYVYFATHKNPLPLQRLVFTCNDFRIFSISKIFSGEHQIWDTVYTLRDMKIHYIFNFPFFLATTLESLVPTIIPMISIEFGTPCIHWEARRVNTFSIVGFFTRNVFRIVSTSINFTIEHRIWDTVYIMRSIKIHYL